jgi:hypothetical protein
MAELDGILLPSNRTAMNRHGRRGERLYAQALYPQLLHGASAAGGERGAGSSTPRVAFSICPGIIQK